MVTSKHNNIFHTQYLQIRWSNVLRMTELHQSRAIVRHTKRARIPTWVSIPPSPLNKDVNWRSSAVDILLVHHGGVTNF